MKYTKKVRNLLVFLASIFVIIAIVLAWKYTKFERIEKISNEILYRNGWKYVRYEKINETAFRILDAQPSKNYVKETEVGKVFMLYPEVEVNKTRVGYEWIREIDLDVIENVSIEIKFVRPFNFSTFPIFLLKRNDNTYEVETRFDILWRGMECTNETKFATCRVLVNLSDSCAFFKGLMPVDCPLSGVHKFYFMIRSLDKTIVYVKEIIVSKVNLLNLREKLVAKYGNKLIFN
jgi:hypothetical protein